MLTFNNNIIPVQTAATITTSAVHTVNAFNMSAQIAATGSAAGTLKLQASNDYPTDGTAPTNWSDIPSATVSVSGAGAFLIPKTDICYEWIRVVYTNSGTGTISASIKSLGE